MCIYIYIYTYTHYNNNNRPQARRHALQEGPHGDQLAASERRDSLRITADLYFDVEIKTKKHTLISALMFISEY